MKFTHLAAPAFTLLLLTGCASLSSVEFKEENRSGLRYFLPRSDLLITVNLKASKVDSVGIATTEHYPDPDHAYVLNHQRSAFAKTSTDIGINDKGLLVSNTSSTTSRLTEAFRDLASLAGIAAGLKSVSGHDEIVCGSDSANTFRIVFPAAAAQRKICGLTFEFVPLAGAQPAGKFVSSGSDAGLYYRQNVYYLVTASGKDYNTARIVASPSHSATLFLPVARSLFTDVSTTMTFKDGIPEKFKTETDGELVSALKLPAQVLSAYFTAVGDTFSRVGTRESQEIAAMNSDLKLQIAKIRYEACVLAIKARDDDKVKSLGCGS